MSRVTCNTTQRQHLNRDRLKIRFVAIESSQRKYVFRSFAIGFMSQQTGFSRRLLGSEEERIDLTRMPGDRDRDIDLAFLWLSSNPFFSRRK
jgi:hypothetical protein